MKKKLDERTIFESGNELCKQIKDVTKRARLVGIVIPPHMFDTERHPFILKHCTYVYKPGTFRCCRTCETLACLYNQEDSDDE